MICPRCRERGRLVLGTESCVTYVCANGHRWDWSYPIEEVVRQLKAENP